MDLSSLYFTNDEYGLLNAAKIMKNKLQYNSSMEIINEYPSLYSNLQVILLAIIMTAMMIVIVIGNMLVVIAIATENNLTNVQNWFIASLAVADMLIGLIVMPFSLADELMGYWMFGEVYCEIHAAVDVLLCTASIMNICLIALDRYWSITRAIDYLNARTPAKVALMIITVWILSGLISIPPLLGWKQDQDLSWFTQILYEKGNKTQMEFIQDIQDSGRMNLENFTSTLELVVYPQCGLSQDLGYVMYSAFGSFYIPSCIMVFVYIKIYYAARDRARRNITNKHKKQNKNKKSKAREKRNRLKEEKLILSRGEKSGKKHLNNGNLIPLIAKPRSSEVHNGESEKQAVSVISSNPDTKNNLSSTEVHLPLPCGACSNLSGSKHRRSVGVSTYEDNNDEGPQEAEAVGGGSHPPSSLGASKETTARGGGDTIERSSSNDSGQVRCIKLTSKYFKTPYLLGSKRRSSKEARQVIDTGKARILKSSSTLELTKKKSPNSPTNHSLSSFPLQETEAEREKKRVARKKERRATLILGLIMGSFIACWFPFFFLYSISPVCPICEDATAEGQPPTTTNTRSEPSAQGGCCVMGWGFSFAFWMGYSNSALNPVIYTVFNKDFRRAFKRILFK